MKYFSGVIMLCVRVPFFLVGFVGAFLIAVIWNGIYGGQLSYAAVAEYIERKK